MTEKEPPAPDKEHTPNTFAFYRSLAKHAERAGETEVAKELYSHARNLYYEKIKASRTDEIIENRIARAIQAFQILVTLGDEEASKYSDFDSSVVTGMGVDLYQGLNSEIANSVLPEIYSRLGLTEARQSAELTRIADPNDPEITMVRFVAPYGITLTETIETSEEDDFQMWNLWAHKD